MINEAFSLIREELVDYLEINGYESDAQDMVLVENIGLFDSSSSGINFDDKIVLTLVNIEEESTLKNLPAVRKNFPLAQYANPPVYLNLYMLVTACNKSSSGMSYLDSLEKLSIVIRFFNGKTSFSTKTSSFYDPIKFGIQEILDMKITHELYTCTFEQINHLWGTLGGKQMPFLMYKLRLVAISDRKVLRDAALIQEIETKSNKL
jgi:hypothetical protein